MNINRIAALIYTFFTLVVVAFQIGLALGAPWGEYAMGGAYPGQFPAALRFTALIQAVMLLFLAGVVLSRAGVALARWSRASTWLIWIVVGFSAISLILNLVTPSSGERMLWAPVALILLVTSLIVAIRGRRAVSE